MPLQAPGVSGKQATQCQDTNLRNLRFVHSFFLLLIAGPISLYSARGGIRGFPIRPHSFASDQGSGSAREPGLSLVDNSSRSLIHIHRPGYSTPWHPGHTNRIALHIHPEPTPLRSLAGLPNISIAVLAISWSLRTSAVYFADTADTLTTI